MEKCEQCGKPSIFDFEGHPLCISCYSLLQQTLQMEQNRSAEYLNYLTESMDATVGISGILPRYQVTRPEINNIHIDRSIIGAVNTGNIKHLEVAMDNLNNMGGSEITSLLKEFTEKVLVSEDINDEIKNEVIEQVSFVASELSSPSEIRKSVVKTTLNSIKDSVTTVNGLVTLWNTLHTQIGTLLGLN